VPSPSASTVGAFQHAACAAAAGRTPSCLSIRTSALLSFPFYSVGRVGVQPAAEPRHVQRHRHGVDVFGALRARALPSTSTVGAFPARCLHRRRRPLALPARLLPLLLCFLFYSAVRKFVQPVAELGHVQRHEHVVHVSGVLHACITVHHHSRGLSCTLHAPPPLARPPSPHVAPLAMLLFYSAVRVGVQPAAKLRHVQRHEHVLHV